VRLLVSADLAVPVTWGVRRPVILLPAAAARWSETHRRAVLLHELAHARGGDVLFSVAARLACALFWFHPAAWWVARRLRDECELASDDCVLEHGVLASDYAELLVQSADAARGGGEVRPVAAALSARAGLRQRLAAIVEPRRDVRAPARTTVALAAALTVSVAVPMSAVRLVPNKNVLTTLMQDSRWESRAYAVIGLAQRPDSVEVARAAAERDPNPRVRAWAKFALGGEVGTRVASPLLHELSPHFPDRR
jgi:hypothetical protein